MNKNTSDTDITFWKGTTAQWTSQSISTQHPEYVCFITDDDTSGFQAEKVVNQNINENAIKFWSGTQEEYDAITTKDSDTIYNVKNENMTITSLLEAIYPIGSIYIGVMEYCPISALLGTWVKISSGRVLQGADENHPVGSLIEAGLPNITGAFNHWHAQSDGNALINGSSGALFDTNSTSSVYKVQVSGTTTTTVTTGFNASRSSSIYGNSDTVQAPAYAVNIWKRVS